MTRVPGSYVVPPVSWSMRATELARLAGSAVQPQATSQPGQLSDTDVRDLAYDVQMLAAAVEEWARDASRLARDAKATAEHVLNKHLGTVDGSTWLQIELNRLAQHLYGIIQQEAEPGATTEQSSHRTWVMDGHLWARRDQRRRGRRRRLDPLSGRCPVTVRTVTCVEITCDVCGSPIDEYGAHYDSVEDAADAAADGDWSVSPDRTSWVCPDCVRRPGGAQ